MAFDSITVIFSPYHTGIHNDAVGKGAASIRDKGLIPKLRDLGIEVEQAEIEGTIEGEGDIGRSFEVFRRTARLVTAARNKGSFPIIISGNCGASVGVLAGLHGSEEFKDLDSVNCVWFDAHGDLNLPDTSVSGYFDGMSISILADLAFKAIAKTISGFRPLDLKKLVHVGLRDVDELEQRDILAAGYPVVWGGDRVDFAKELEKLLGSRSNSPTLVHLDLDVLDQSVGQVNKFPPTSGGMQQEDILACFRLLAAKTKPLSLTVAGHETGFGVDDKVAGIAIRAVVEFVKKLRESN